MYVSLLAVFYRPMFLALRSHQGFDLGREKRENLARLIHVICSEALGSPGRYMEGETSASEAGRRRVEKAKQA